MKQIQAYLQTLLIISITIFSTFATFIDIRMQMQPFVNVSEPSTQKIITINTIQPYIHQIQYLEPQFIYAHECRSLPGELKEQLISTFPIINTQSQSPQQPIKPAQYIYSQKYSTLYYLQQSQRVLNFYTFSQKQKKLKYIQRFQFTTNDCGSHLISSFDQEFLFIFTCDKIIRIDMKKGMAGVDVVVKNMEMFYGGKVVKGDGIFVWSSQSEGVRIYTITQQNKLELTQTLTQLNSPSSSLPQKITDIVLSPTTLYLLGHSQTLFIFQLLGTGKFQSKTNISLSNICSTNCKHRKLILHISNIYIYSIDNNQQFISQLQVQKQFTIVYFIRYFKGRKNYVSMDIWNQKLMVVYEHAISLFQINRDPRSIEKLINGISNTHFQQIYAYSKISQNLFIKKTITGTYILKLSIKKPKIYCQFNHSKTPIKQFELQIIQPCKIPQHTIHLPYYYSCLTKDILKFKLQQQIRQYHIFAVISVLLFCSAVVIVLVIWRKSKMDLIQGIVDEINKFRKKQMQQKVQFVQQKQVVRQTNWNQMQQSYSISDKDPQQVENKEKGSDNHIKQPKQKQIQMKQIQAKKNTNNKIQKKSSKQHHQLNQQILIQEEQENQVQGTQRNMIS